MKVLQTNLDSFESSLESQKNSGINGINGVFKSSFKKFINLGDGQEAYIKDAIDSNTLNAASDEQIEEARKNGEFIPPWSYKEVTSSSTGFTKIQTSPKKNTTKYFWIEELRNWCCFSYDLYYDTNDPNRYRDNLNFWQLYVWNGRDAFIPIVNTKIESKYEISNLQNKYLNNCLFTFTHRGNNKYSDKNETFNVWNNYTTKLYNGSPQIIVHAIIVKSNRTYSINDEDNYQTIRAIAGTPKYTDNNYNLTTNNRQGMPTGCPALWRLSSGELALCTYLVWGGNGFVNGENQVDFINEVCQNAFGSGTDKTIEKDWLKDPEINETEEIASSDSQFGLNNSSLKNTQIDQTNKETENTIKMKFTLNDVNVSVEENTDSDLVSRW